MPAVKKGKGKRSESRIGTIPRRRNNVATVSKPSEYHSYFKQADIDKYI